MPKLYDHNLHVILSAAFCLSSNTYHPISLIVWLYALKSLEFNITVWD